MRKELYQRSGIVPPKAILFSLAATLIVGPILGVIYAFAIWYNPIVYISMLASAAFGAGMGFVVGKAMRVGHARNAAVVTVMALLATAFAHAVGWITWVAIAFSDLEGFEWTFLLDPSSFGEAVLAINEHGVWSLKNSTPTGVFLWLIWGIEALVVLGVAGFLAAGQALDGIYCEHCKNWCVSTPSLVSLSEGEDHEDAAKRLIDGQLEALRELPLPEPEEHHWLNVRLDECHKCKRTNAFTLERVTRTFEKDGEAKLNTEELIEAWLLTKEQAQMVRESAERAFSVLREEDETTSVAS